METFHVGKIEEFEDKSKKVVSVRDEEVGVFRLGEEFFAWRNICPHQGGPICQGRIFSLVLENIDGKMESHGRVYDNDLSLIHISEPTRRTPISYAGVCL